MHVLYKYWGVQKDNFQDKETSIKLVALAISKQCWASYFLKVTSYILLATELFSYSYILHITHKIK